MISLFILILCIIACPGFYVSGNLITAADIIIPILLFTSRHSKKLKLYRIQKYLVLYIVSIVISIFVGTFLGNGISVTSFLKALRFSYVLLLPYIIFSAMKSRKYSESTVLKFILISAIVSALTGILLFVTESTLYEAPEMFIFFGKYIHRAGGVFAEANYFGLMMSMMIMVAIESIYQKENNILAFFSIISCGIALVLTDSRSAILSLVICIFIRFFNFKSKRNFIVLLIIIAVSVFSYKQISFVNSFINNRVLSMFSSYQAGYSANEISSGRINIWKKALKEYSSNSFIEMLFGTGYKSIKTNVLSDNSYISTLVTLGAFGVFSFVFLWGYLIKRAIKIKSDNTFSFLFKDFIIVYIIVMLFLDAMTTVRCFYLIIIVYFLSLFGRKYYDNMIEINK